MNPVAKIAPGICLDYIRRKGIDPLDDEDSDEADEALRDTKFKLHRFVDDLSHEDVCRAGVRKQQVKQHVAAGSTDKVSKEKKEKSKSKKCE